MIELSTLHQGTIETQRPHLDRACVERYKANLDDAEPVLVYNDEGRDELLLVNGHHRVEAARQLGRTTIRADVQLGTREDATRYRDLR
jgi:hypothetical protein